MKEIQTFHASLSILMEQMMKKLLCVLAVIGLSCVLGCAPTDNGGADDGDNTTSQIQSQQIEIAIAKV